jgi:two-component system sensor histidine kinase HydH
MGKEVDRLNRVIQELLNFARSQKPNLQFIEIQPLIQHALKLIQTDLHDKEIHIRILMDETQSILALADGDMMIQVLLNLFINALEAMKKDGLLTISVSELKDQVTIEISDNGHGIAQQDISRIFDPFFSTKISGTGLGLAIVYRLIEQMQGEIEVRSEVDKGTAFKINLGKEL